MCIAAMGSVQADSDDDRHWPALLWVVLLAGLAWHVVVPPRQPRQQQDETTTKR